MPPRFRLLVAFALAFACACAPARSTPEPAPPATTTTSAAAKSADVPPHAGALNAQAQRGREIYGQMCAVCHGENGEGYKADEAPALAHPDFLGSVQDDFLRTAILYGRRGTTMSAWARSRGGPLAVGDVNAVIAFLRTWQKQPAIALDERPLHGDAKRGGELFARECARCHGEAGRTGPNVRVGDPELLARASDGFLRHAIAKGRAGTTMPGYAASLGEAAIDDVIAFLRSAGQPAETARAAPAKPPPIPLGPVPLNRKGPEPNGFVAHPGTTKADVVHAQLERGARMALLDARAPSDYMTEHIAGAVSVPFYDPSPYLEKLPKDAWLVCYCACPHAESRSLAQKLVDAGFTKVTVLDEGLGYWKSKNYGVRSGTKP